MLNANESVKIKELQKKSKSGLEKILRERRERLRALRFDLDQGKLKDTSQIKKTKKDIAKILTLINEQLKKK